MHAALCIEWRQNGKDAKVAQGRPAVFPIPREATFERPALQLGTDTVILTPEQPSADDLFLSRLLVAELSDRYGIALRTRRVSELPRHAPFILMGSVSNPLVRQACTARRLSATAASPGPEGYVLQVDGGGALVAGSDDAGAFYGLQSLRQLVERSAEGARIRGAAIRDWPHMPFRAIKVFLPGQNQIPFFKRFIADFMALYKYNRLVLEMNAGMRLDRHPELNAGWIELARDLNLTRRDRSTGPGAQYQNSVHQDTADGGVLEKEEVADLVRYARARYIEVIPEIPSLTHSYYLLTRHRELAEIPNAEWPDTYCPLNPKSYDLVFDVLDEYVEVMRPKIVHAGKDEWRMPVGICSRCRGKDSRDLLVQDLIKIRDHLRGRGVRMALWGDHLLEAVRGSEPAPKTSPAGYHYRIPPALSPAQVKEKIPKDILVFNWFWKDARHKDGWGEQNDITLEQFGFEQAYGNFMPDIENFGRRSKRRDVLGGAPSSWAISSELSLGKDRMREFIGCANLLWSTHWPDQPGLSEIVQALMPGVRRNFSGTAAPSESGDRIVSVPLEICGNKSGTHAGFDLARLRTGELTVGPRPLVLSASACIADGSSAISIPVGEDSSSLIFLHASARPAGNEVVDRYVYNVEDTADLLGWYEMLYEDGLVLTVPIRYGVNILEWNRSENRESRTYCYGADQVPAGARDKPFDLFAWGWTNPRLGKRIEEVRLKIARDFRDTTGKIAPANPILLKGLSYVRKRQPPAAATPLDTGKAAY